MIKIYLTTDGTQKVHIVHYGHSMYDVPAPLGWSEEAIYAAIGEVISNWEPRQRRITGETIEHVKSLFGSDPAQVHFEVSPEECRWSQRVHGGTLQVWTRDMGLTWGASCTGRHGLVWSHDGLDHPDRAIGGPANA